MSRNVSFRAARLVAQTFGPPPPVHTGRRVVGSWRRSARTTGLVPGQVGQVGQVGQLHSDGQTPMDNERKLVPLSGIKEEHFQWVWRDRIPLGALTVLEGDPGQSKSTLLYDLVARVTSGKPMPFCKGKPKPAGVVLIQGEDRLDATVKPTLKALGADLDRVLVYERKRFLEQPWSLPKDVSLIEEAAQQVDAKVIVRSEER